MDNTSLFGADDADSTVVGVLLLVALTVVLATVSSAFVLGLDDTPDEDEVLNSLDNASTGDEYDRETSDGTVTQQEQASEPDDESETDDSGDDTVADASDGDTGTGSEISLPTGENRGSPTNKHDTVEVETADRDEVEIEGTTAILGGELTELAEGENATVYFEWCAPPSCSRSDFRKGGEVDETEPQTLRKAAEFAEKLPIEADQLYLFRAVATVGDETDKGSVTMIRVRDGEIGANVTVETVEATDVNDSSAKLRGNLTRLENADNATVYFEWGENATSLGNTTEKAVLNGTSGFNWTLTGLEPGTTYDYRAVAEAGNASDEGEVLNVTTEEGTEDEAVAAVTNDPDGVGSAVATLNGTLTELVGSEAATVSFEYRQNGTDEEWGNLSAGEASAGQHFTANVTGLEANTTYEYRAVAEAGNATDTGENVTFTTGEADAEEATLTVETVEATGVNDSAAILRGELTELEAADNATASFQYRENGSEDWTALSAGAVNVSEQFDRELTGLEPGTEYEFRALAETDEASDEGDVLNFTTGTGPEAELSGLDIAGRGDSATVTAGDDESVSVTVTNVGDQAGAFKMSLAVSEAVNETAESHERIETTETSGELDPGSSATVEFEEVTGDLEEGNYTVEIVTENDSASGDLAVESDGSDEDESDGGDDSPPEDDDGDDSEDEGDGDDGDGNDSGDDSEDEGDSDESDGGDDDESDESDGGDDGSDGTDDGDGDNGDSGDDGDDSDDGDGNDSGDGDESEDSNDGNDSGDGDESEDSNDGNEGDESEDSNDGNEGDESDNRGNGDNPGDGDESDGDENDDDGSDGGDEADGGDSDDSDDGDEADGGDSDDSDDGDGADGGDSDDSDDGDEAGSGDETDGGEGDDNDESDETGDGDDSGGNESDESDESDDGDQSDGGDDSESSAGEGSDDGDESEGDASDGGDDNESDGPENGEEGDSNEESDGETGEEDDEAGEEDGSGEATGSDGTGKTADGSDETDEEDEETPDEPGGGAGGNAEDDEFLAGSISILLLILALLLGAALFMTLRYLQD